LAGFEPKRSGQYTPTLSACSLDLQHIAALALEAMVFLASTTGSEKSPPVEA
jgi:hypothetical protein